MLAVFATAGAVDLVLALIERGGPRHRAHAKQPETARQ
ncbi:hypothetical protein KCH_76230 [Kitasatospora cheerisanensis KCTC 2395]|uniref:Uncharacterized protein n=1 Tax=Kitasatospora cheerisanensis KCTC 2395 TaxID=1348663 RepID=A0A066YKX0_9ACTN|nr:hypothetical protein KCH_76230 [Kitasatospora cheerisanensis KCTC 2395]